MLVLTARDEKESVVRLLNAGADDYVAKPFDLGELLARAKALVRRGKGQRSPVIAVADLRINTIERTVRRGPREIQLAPMEYRVLEYLAHRGRGGGVQDGVAGAPVRFQLGKVRQCDRGVHFRVAAEDRPRTRGQADSYSARAGIYSAHGSGIASRTHETVFADGTHPGDGDRMPAPAGGGLTAAAVVYGREQLGNAFDASLDGRAMSTLALVRYSEDRAGSLVFRSGAGAALVPSRTHKDLFEIRKADGEVLARSEVFPPVAESQTGRYADFSLDGVPYRA